MAACNCEVMEAIGGYFSLESRSGEHFHTGAIRLNLARCAFLYVLLARRFKKVYVPYYTCKVVLQQLHNADVDYEYYHINENFEPISIPQLKEREAFLYTNYFGLKQDFVKSLACRYGERLIVDNAQAFYAEPVAGIDTFYSTRKFFGVADGAYLYTEHTLNQTIEQDVSFGRMSHLLKRVDLGAEAGYQEFKINEEEIDDEPLKQMSKLTECMLLGIDYDSVAERRRVNYQILEEKLGASNLLGLEMDDSSVPMVYPYLPQSGGMRGKLIANKIFVAQYWDSVIRENEASEWEHNAAKNICFLPIDQRYRQKDMERIISVICD